MKSYLLDVNVLVALAWPIHVHHDLCHEWFARKVQNGFSTCPITQCGFVRISSNKALTAYAVAPALALESLRIIIDLPSHRFWPDDLSAPDAIQDPRRLQGFRQTTDAYLIGLARKHDGILATLDSGVASLSPSPDLVELVRPAL